jgi:predicted  nucleic acid-binding Zn-ribbon protein
MQRLDRAGIEVLLGTEQFKSWFAALSGLHHRLELVTTSVDRLSESFAETNFRRNYRQDVAEGALLGGADVRNTCQNLRSEVASLENEAFRQLAAFELARDAVKSLWERITAIEHRCDDFPDEASRVRARARHRGELRKLREKYNKESDRKESLWQAEETLWLKVAERTLTIPELEVRSGRLEGRYAQVMQQVEQLNGRAQELEAELSDGREELLEVERQLGRLRGAARASFSCLCHEDFLYWPPADDSRIALVVPLRDNAKDYNIEVRVGQIYECDTEKGVQHLEPVGDAIPDAEDIRRLRAFFGDVA